MNKPEVIHVPSVGQPAFTGEITEGKLSQIIGGLMIPNQALAKALAIEVRRLRIECAKSNPDTKGESGESPEPLSAGGEVKPPTQ